MDKSLKTVAISVIAVVLMSMGVASAHTASFGATHTLGYSASLERFRGVLSSSRAACERGRTVKLFRVVGGPSVPDALVATRTTNLNGVWTKAAANPPAGTYYAVALREAVASQLHTHICTRSVSNNIVRQPPPPPPDADGDGIPDSEDCAPNDANPPDETECYAPGTPYSINQGAIPQGSNVWIQELLITAITSGGNTAWGGVQPTDAHYTGVDHSGLRLDLSEVVGESPSVGTRISVLGEVTAQRVMVHKITFVNFGETPAVHNVPVASLTSDPPASALNGVLVQIGGVTIQSQAAGDWMLTEGILVDNFIIGSLPDRPDGSAFSSITGIASTAGSAALLPRSMGDIVDA